MHIVYHHYKDKSKELEDVKFDWWTCPPELICSEKEKKQLTRCGKYAMEEKPI